MPRNILTTTSTIKCPHLGTAILKTSNNSIFIDGAPALLESDIHSIVGCILTIGTKYSPCIRIEWSNGNQKTKSKNNLLLAKTSIGKCISAENVTQGIAIIFSNQIKVDSQ